MHVGGRLPTAYVHGGVLGNSIATDLMLSTLFGSSVDVPKTGACSALSSLQNYMDMLVIVQLSQSRGSLGRVPIPLSVPTGWVPGRPLGPCALRGLVLASSCQARLPAPGWPGSLAPLTAEILEERRMRQEQ